MFEYKHYVPILKAKEGEFKALEVTFDATKQFMTPLLEIVEVPWDYENEVEEKEINVHLSNIGKKTLNAWGTSMPIFIDSNVIDSARVMNDGITHHLSFLFDDFRSKNILSIPVTGLTRHSSYKNTVNEIAAIDGRGICLRLAKEDIASSDIKDNIDTDLQFYNLTPKQVDLIIDFGSIANADVRLLLLLVISMINNNIPYIHNWRTLTITSTAFPIDLSEIDSGTFDTIDRNEWIIWKMLLTSDILRMPTFGDYSIAHPEVVGINPRFIRMSASIRYTYNDYWLIARGRGLQRYGYEQYYTLCESLVVRPEYSGATFSWADNYISECSTRAVGVGNPTTWRKIANNHHFEKTVYLISNLL